MNDGYPRNFRPGEFYCKCGTCLGVPPNKAATRHLAWVLQQIRDLVNVPIKITSAYRCEQHNQNVGGSTHSQHKLGTAADLQAKGLKAQQLHAAILDLVSSKRIPEGGLGLYETFVHYDIRPKKARWNG
jgi:uncharacterized protein YcbK (DUF882 family)